MSESKFDASKANGVHFKLAQMEGEWEGTSAVYFEGDTPVDEAAHTATIKPILGGRFMLHEYTGSFQGKPLEGLAIYGYHIPTEKFECAWVDSFHTGTKIFLSEDKQPSKLFSVMVHYDAGGQEWGWRTEIEMPSEDELIITASNYMPDGTPAGGVVTKYKRNIS